MGLLANPLFFSLKTKTSPTSGEESFQAVQEDLLNYGRLGTSTRKYNTNDNPPQDEVENAKQKTEILESFPMVEILYAISVCFFWTLFGRGGGTVPPATTLRAPEGV